MKRLHFLWLTACLGWLLVLGPAQAQLAGPAPAEASAVTVAPIVLSGDTPTVSLDGRSRYWMDPDGRLAIDDVESQAGALPWAMREAGHQYNIDGKALWFEFDAVARPDNTRWLLEIALSGMDRAQLFYRGPDGKWVVQEAGDTRPVSQWPLPGRFPTFILSGVTDQPVRYWLRLEHDRVDFASAITLSSESALFAAREQEQLLLGAYFGLAALIALVALANAVVYRDRDFAVYAAYVAALGIGQLAYLGIGAQHVWDRFLEWNQVSTFLLPGISASVGLWFVRSVCEPARFSRAFDRLVWALILAQLLAVAVDTYFTSRATFSIVLLLAFMSLGTIMALIVLVWRRGDDPYVSLLALGFLPVLVLAMFPLARGLNLIPTGTLTRYGLSIGAALEMPILFYALNLRGNRRREAALRAGALSRTDPLTGLAHARLLQMRLDGALVRANGQKHQCALLVIRLVNYEAIAAGFGREAADRALVLSGSRLRRVISDIDVAARVGDQHFALLLEGPTHSVNALATAQHVVASGLRTSEVLPGDVTLRFHVAVAMLPDRDHDAATALQWLLLAVNEIPADARKSIRAVNF